MRSLIRLPALLLAGLFGSAAVASAAIVVFNFELTPEQETATVVSDGFGFANVTLDTDTNELTWEVTFQDLTSGLTAAHFHGPADFGEDTGFFVNMNPETGVTSGVLLGSDFISETEAGWILDGMTYINLHTEMFGPGEIRGQVVPEPRTYALVAGILALGGAIFWRRRRARQG